MRTIDEGHLRFEFGPEWKHVEQWDKTPAFNDGIHGVDGVRALDIIALSDDECLLLEVKDFRDQNDEQASDERRERGHRKGRHKHKRRSQHEDGSRGAAEALGADALVEQVAQKVAGTLAGLVGAARMQDTRYAGEFARFLATHRSEGRKVRIVLWIEGEPTSKGKSIRAKSNLGALTNLLKRKVEWLTQRPVQVLSSASPPALPDVTVIDMRP